MEPEFESCSCQKYQQNAEKLNNFHSEVPNFDRKIMTYIPEEYPRVIPPIVW